MQADRVFYTVGVHRSHSRNSSAYKPRRSEGVAGHNRYRALCWRPDDASATSPVTAHAAQPSSCRHQRTHRFCRYQAASLLNDQHFAIAAFWVARMRTMQLLFSWKAILQVLLSMSLIKLSWLACQICILSIATVATSPLVAVLLAARVFIVFICTLRLAAKLLMCCSGALYTIACRSKGNNSLSAYHQL